VKQGWVIFGSFHVVRVEVATTREEIAQGLAGRASLAPGFGMLFDLRAVGRQGSFTTHGMRFPLDFVTLREGRVSGILVQIPPGMAAVARFSADYVLEVPGGWVTQARIKEGDGVSVLDA
jgi:uncharacterized membrane protein (UPF0127 family)